MDTWGLASWYSFGILMSIRDSVRGRFEPILYPFFTTIQEERIPSLPRHHSSLDHQYDPRRHAVAHDNPHHNAHILAHIPRLVAILVQHTLAGDLALVGERRDIHALALVPARVRPPGELVDHHALEDVLLVVPVVKDVFVEHVEQRRLHHEA